MQLSFPWVDACVYNMYFNRVHDLKMTDLSQILIWKWVIRFFPPKIRIELSNPVFLIFPDWRPPRSLYGIQRDLLCRDLLLVLVQEKRVEFDKKHYFSLFGLYKSIKISQTIKVFHWTATPSNLMFIRVQILLCRYFLLNIIKWPILA